MSINRHLAIGGSAFLLTLSLGCGGSNSNNTSPMAVLKSVSPALGPSTGGIAVTLDGENFVNGATVSFAGTPATQVTVMSATRMKVMLPPNLGAFGKVPIVVQNPGSQAESRADLFSYFSGQLAFSSASAFSAGTILQNFTVADFNRDGKLDLAVSNPGGRSVGVLLGLGGSAFAMATQFPVGAGPSGVGALDLNGDGILDLVVPNSVDNNVSILIGDGTGKFGTATTVAVGKNPSAMLVADFNGDGRSDVAVANLIGNSVSVLLNNGQGSFSAASEIPVGTQPTSIAVGDFNGDQRPDLIFTLSTHPAALSLLPGNGSGGFGPATNISTNSSDLASLVTSDFNNDGKLDIAVTSPGDNKTRVLLGSGNGTFTAVTNDLPISGAAGMGLVAADINGDGNSDLVITSDIANNVSIVLGDGSGNFSPVANFAAGMRLQGIAIGDFNGDKRPDIAFSNQASGQIAVLLNQSQ